MATLFDYVHWRGDLSFNKSSFNEIDNLVFSEICYIDFEKAVSKFPSNEKILLKDAIETVFSHVKKEDMVLGLIVPYSIVELIDKVQHCKRYSHIEVSNYVNKVNNRNGALQFSAMCFHISDDLIYVAYRGTDDTLIGWQEDIDMVCTFPVPAQKRALKYIEKIAELYPEATLIVGGHSKGGNLATYASIYAKEETQHRIYKVFNNDGPGFVKEKVDLEKFEKVRHKITRIIPESSIIGMALDPFAGKTKVVKSNVKGVNQHDAFSWLVDIKRFVRVDKISDDAENFDTLMTSRLTSLNEEERIALANDVFLFVKELNRDTLIEIQKKDSLRLIKFIRKMNAKNRKLFMEMFYALIKYKQL